MDEDDTIPRFSYDLIDWLDNAIASPSLPQTAEGFAQLDDTDVRRAAFQSGARALVNMLRAWRDEEEDENDTDSDVDDVREQYGSIFRPDHSLAERGGAGVRMAEIDAQVVSSDRDSEG